MVMVLRPKSPFILLFWVLHRLCICVVGVDAKVIQPEGGAAAGRANFFLMLENVRVILACMLKILQNNKSTKSMDQ